MATLTRTATGAEVRAGATTAAAAASSGGGAGLRLCDGPGGAGLVLAVALGAPLFAAAGSAPGRLCGAAPAPAALEGEVAAGAGSVMVPGREVAGAAGGVCTGGDASGGTAAVCRTAANTNAARNPARIADQITW